MYKDVENSNSVQTPYENKEGKNEEEDELDLDMMGGMFSSLHQDDYFLMIFLHAILY